MTATKGRSYEDAIALLDSLQSNRAIVSSISDSSRDMNLDAIPEMIEWTRKAGYEAEDFTRRGLRCIHAAGTKGKGSVCAMVDNILRQYQSEDTADILGAGGQVVPKHKTGLGKIGLYTSPHLMTVRERIRIDGSPISESLFTRYFFELWDRFTHAASISATPHPDPTSSVTKPGYFRYLTIMALHTFMEEGVETAIVECGIGGEYDSTNILPAEALTTTAITKLGIDHVGMLGDTIEKIAWHKAGIMKAGIPAFTVPQLSEAQEVLQARSVEKGANLKIIHRHPSLEDGTIKLGAEGQFQKDNASLAMAVAASHLSSLGIQDVPPVQQLASSRGAVPEQFIHGLKTIQWAGRCEVVVDGNIEWLIDGAHTVDSLEETGIWYMSKLEQAQSEGRPPTKTMLIFNQQDRNPKPLLSSLFSFRSLPHGKSYPDDHVREFTFAAFCTNIPFKSEMNSKDLEHQEDTARWYSDFDRNPLYMTYASIEEAVELARRISKDEDRVFVLVTGSLHLVGGLMKVLEKQKKESRSF